MKKALKKKTPTNGKCEYFCNAHCSYHCPNASLEGACDYWDLDPSDFGMEYISCRECLYNDKFCSCDDCYFMGNKEYCPKCKKEN